MQIRYDQKHGVILFFPMNEIKVVVALLKGLYNYYKFAFIREAVEDMEADQRPRLTLTNYFHFCSKCVREIDEKKGDNFVHYINGDKDEWIHRQCPPFEYRE